MVALASVDIAELRTSRELPAMSPSMARLTSDALSRKAAPFTPRATAESLRFSLWGREKARMWSAISIRSPSASCLTLQYCPLTNRPFLAPISSRM